MSKEKRCNAMYKTGLVLKNSDLLAQITALHIWGENTGFEIEAVWVDVKSLTDVWKKKCFDLLIVEASLVGPKEYQIFREIKKSQCSHIVFCGQNGNFESARIGILLGIDDYWTLPFDQKTIRSLFQRIQSENVKTIDSIEKYANELLGLFLRQEAELYNYTEHPCRLHLFSEAADQVVQAVFEQNDWLDLYLNEQEFLSPEAIDVEEHKNKLKQLFDEFLLLNPRHNESLDSIIQYMRKHCFWHPESLYSADIQAR